MAHACHPRNLEVETEGSLHGLCCVMISQTHTLTHLYRNIHTSMHTHGHTCIQVSMHKRHSQRCSFKKCMFIGTASVEVGGDILYIGTSHSGLML